MRHAVLLEEREGRVTLTLLVPGAVPELHEHLVPVHLLPGPLEVVERRFLRHHVRRELEEDPAELSSEPQGLECFVETPEDLRAELA